MIHPEAKAIGDIIRPVLEGAGVVLTDKIIGAISRVIGKAVAAEREACAELAAVMEQPVEEPPSGMRIGEMRCFVKPIAQAIRQRGPL